MIALFTNLSVRWKVLSAPALLILVLIGAGLYFVSMQRAGQAAGDALMAGPVHDAETVADFTKSAWMAQVRLYQLTATAANETDDKKLKVLADGATKALANMTEKLRTLGDPARDNAKTDGKLGQLQGAVANYAKQGKSVIDMADSDVATALTFMMGAARSFATIENLTDDLTNSSKSVRDDKVALNKAALEQQKLTLILVMLSAILTGSLISLLISRGISKPLTEIAGVLIELTNDRIVDVPYAMRHDEIGEIAKATEVFKQSIGEKIINLRVRAALDVVKSNVMVADTDYNILYMNGTLKDMLHEAEAELRKVMPEFDAGKLIGANMDVFHKSPAHQRKMLDALTATHDSHITVGSQKFYLIASPVVDTHGNRAGTVVEWRNETMEKAIEGEVHDVVKAAVAGDFSKRVPLGDKKDFMLNLASAMNSLCENTASPLQDLESMLGALAEGDLTLRITADYQGMFGTLKEDANKMAERIGATVGDIKLAAREVTGASAEISTSTTDLSQRTEEQAASLEQTSAAMTEISTTVMKNAENAQAANQSAADTREVADRGGEVVAQAVKAMGKIEESSRKISDIIGVIDEIARQTNLLALNAAVEAARAGDAGRGFAVVASEVRSLAQRSSQAAKDIKDLITHSNDQVKDGVDLVNRTGISLKEIVDSIRKVADIVADIANASNEQASGIAQVNKALAQMDEVTQQNSALVEENAATAKTLEQQATAMDERVAFFKLEDAVEGGPAQRPDLRDQRAVAAVPSRGSAAHKERPMAAPSPPRVAAAASAGSVGRTQGALALAVKDNPNWKEF
ncbi:MAG: methyl-accepting chemotaxis protein [Xanthobacteraceae bacterium]|jgi:methyl-accepting chemotaxis protein